MHLHRASSFRVGLERDPPSRGVHIRPHQLRVLHLDEEPLRVGLSHEVLRPLVPPQGCSTALANRSRSCRYSAIARSVLSSGHEISRSPSCVARAATWQSSSSSSRLQPARPADGDINEQTHVDMASTVRGGCAGPYVRQTPERVGPARTVFGGRTRALRVGSMGLSAEASYVCDSVSLGKRCWRSSRVYQRKGLRQPSGFCAFGTSRRRARAPRRRWVASACSVACSVRSMSSAAVDRDEFRRRVDDAVLVLFALVAEGLGWATTALLDQDVERAGQVIADDHGIDMRCEELTALVKERLAGGAAFDPDELESLIAVLQIVPELERSADLAEHIAQRALRGVGGIVSPRGRGLIQSMGDVGVRMWRTAATAYRQRSRDASFQLAEADDELDVLATSLVNEGVAEGADPQLAADLALVARFYERLGDHAVNLARRVDEMAAPRRLTPVQKMLHRADCFRPQERRAAAFGACSVGSHVSDSCRPTTASSSCSKPRQQTPATARMSCASSPLR